MLAKVNHYDNRIRLTLKLGNEYCDVPEGCSPLSTFFFIAIVSMFLVVSI